MSVENPSLETLREAAGQSNGADLADALRHAIVAGTLPPGSRLRQPQVAQAFGVSRTPVREALHKLNAWGLVDLVVNHAAVVRPLRRSHYAGTFVVWAELLALAAELAVPRALEIRERLEAAIAEEQAVLEPNGSSPTEPAKRWPAANAAFHDAILDGSASARLRETVEATTAILTWETIWTALADRPHPLAASRREHEELSRLLVAGDAAAASDSMRRHVLALGDAFLRWWDHTFDAEGAA
jgi:DNA-binding GntR family transcriptional regulator